jgi:hypothetical protein
VTHQAFGQTMLSDPDALLRKEMIAKGIVTRNADLWRWLQQMM